MTLENTHVQWIWMGNTSSNGCFCHCHVSFRGCKAFSRVNITLIIRLAISSGGWHWGLCLHRFPWPLPSDKKCSKLLPQNDSSWYFVQGEIWVRFRVFLCFLFNCFAPSNCLGWTYVPLNYNRFQKTVAQSECKWCSNKNYWLEGSFDLLDVSWD